MMDLDGGSSRLPSRLTPLVSSTTALSEVPDGEEESSFEGADSMTGNVSCDESVETGQAEGQVHLDPRSPGIISFSPPYKKFKGKSDISTITLPLLTY
jgi:hypothetical protein